MSPSLAGTAGVDKPPGDLEVRAEAWNRITGVIHQIIDIIMGI